MVKMMDAANAIFRAAYTAVLPHRLVRKAISIDNDQNLVINETGFKCPLRKNIYVAAFGKAACGMSRAMEDIVRENIVDGVVSMPHGTIDLFRKHNLNDLLPRTASVLRYYQGAVNNLPDENAFRAAVEIKDMIGKLKKDDLLLVLISGGGSALLPYPSPGFTLEEKTQLIKLLSQLGADINELNTVRQNLSQLKGGRLAELAGGRAQRVVSLVISDIVGDPLEFIASGPTCPRSSKPSQALDIIRKYELTENTQVPKAIIDFLESAKDTKEDPDVWQRVDNIIIGSNRVALEAGRLEGERLDYRSEMVTSTMTGEAKQIGRDYANHLNHFLSKSNGQFEKHCWLWGGESTVRVKGAGKGGRNQEMVLAFALEANKLKLAEKHDKAKFSFLSAGTDGQDGPTDAAGAVIHMEHLKNLNEMEISLMKECLEKNDSYTFFNQFRDGECHVKCGLTGTNVMDVQVMTVE